MSVNGMDELIILYRIQLLLYDKVAVTRKTTYIHIRYILRMDFILYNSCINACLRSRNMHVTNYLSSLLSVTITNLSL